MRNWWLETRNAVMRQYRLNMTMVGTLATGHARNHSARVIGHGGTIKALQSRGLVGVDRRWTRLGMDVARMVLSGHVKTLDEMHEQALTDHR